MIRAAEGREDTLTMPSATVRELGLGQRRQTVLSFGGMRHYVRLAEDPRAEAGRATLPRRVMERLHMPDYPVYELAVRGNELRVGPVIGLLMSREAAGLNAEHLKHMRRYVREYDRLHGAVVVFSLEGVDPVGRLVEGYCYHPGAGRFEPGIFPYPGVIYRTIGLNRQWKDHFLATVEGGFFNCPYFNKWDTHRWFAADPAIGPHIPATVRYESPRQAGEMLRRYGALYIKPMAGLRGRGVVRVRREGDAARFEYRQGEQNRRDEVRIGPESAAYFAARFSHGRYLLQQALALIRIGGRVADFRCVMQKDQSCRWICQAVIGRRGRWGSVVSNISSGGSAFSMESLGRLPVPLPRREMEALPGRLREFSLSVCAAVDRAGLSCGTLGLDVGVDTSGFLWLIEINNRDPDPTIALDIGDRELYHRLKAGPLFYAKALAGFPARPPARGPMLVSKNSV